MSRSVTQRKTVETVVPLCTVIFVVKKASSSVIVPPTRPEPCSRSEGVSAGVGAAQEATASTSGLWSAGTSKNGSETPKEDRGKHVLKTEGASAVRG